MWRGKGKNHAEIHPAQHIVVKQFFEIAFEQRKTVKEVCDEAGLDRVNVGKWKTKHVPTLSNFEAAINCLGYTLKLEPLPKPDKTNPSEPTCLSDYYLIGF